MKSTTNLLAFGTDGIRGNATHEPFVHHTLIALGKAIAAWAYAKRQEQPKVLVGMDTRISGPRIKQSLVHGLFQQGALVIDGGVLPTPAVCKLVAQGIGFDCGVVISASHNPYYDNGVKVFYGSSLKLTQADEQMITQLAQEFLAGVEYDSPIGGLQELPQATHLYQGLLVKACQNFAFKGVRVVLDCANGAMSSIATQLFKVFGADVITINNKPNGFNINAHSGATHPASLAKAVVEHKALIGFAFDGDGDRVIACDSHGVIKDGDDILAILMTHHDFADEQIVVGTQMTNQGLDEFIKQQGKMLIRSKVGDKYVAAAMNEHNLKLGGEISGHTIVRSYLPSSDGLYVALLTLQTIIMTHNFAFKTFSKFPQRLINLKVAQKLPLDSEPCSSLISRYDELLKGRGRLLIRYSGTESLLRVMAEADTLEHATTVAEALSKELASVLQTKSF